MRRSIDYAFLSNQVFSLDPSSRNTRSLIVPGGVDRRVCPPNTNKETNTLKKNSNFVPKNVSQRLLQETIAMCDLTIVFGPAGTGKSHVSAMEAAEALDSGEVSRIILIRPAREATGESLGFLPGSLEQKLLPYLYPILDSWKDRWTPGKVEALQKEERLEFWPVAYARGRTYRNAFVIIDEAQNLTMEQMYLVLTRLGDGSKMVLNGDWDQSDLKKSEINSKKLLERLRGKPGIGFVEFHSEDIVRHPIVKQVIDAVHEEPPLLGGAS